MVQRQGRRVVGGPETAFVLLAYAWSWSWWVPMAAAGVTTRAGQAWPTHLLGLVGPAVAAVIVTAVVAGRSGLADLGRRVVKVRVGWFWYAVLGATAGMGVAAMAVRGVLGRGWPSAAELTTYSGVGSMPWLVLVVVVLVISGFGEETGWRGFLVERWGARLGLLRTSLLVTAVWVLWHLPLFWVSESYRSFGAGGTVGWLVSITAGSVVLTWMYLGSGGSIWVVAVWHTVFNLVTASAAGADLAAPVLSAAVIATAVVLLRHARSGGTDAAPDRWPTRTVEHRASDRAEPLACEWTEGAAVATYRVKVSGWVTFEAPDDQAARTTAHQLHLSYESDLDAGVVPDASELTTETPQRLG